MMNYGEKSNYAGASTAQQPREGVNTVGGIQDQSQRLEKFAERLQSIADRLTGSRPRDAKMAEPKRLDGPANAQPLAHALDSIRSRQECALAEMEQAFQQIESFV